MPALFTVGGTTIAMSVEFADVNDMLLDRPKAPEGYRTILHPPGTTTFFYQAGGLGPREFAFACEVAGDGSLAALIGLKQQQGTLVCVRHDGTTETFAGAILDDVRDPKEYEMPAGGVERSRCTPVFLVAA